MEEKHKPLYAQAKGPLPAIPYAILVARPTSSGAAEM